MQKRIITTELRNQFVADLKEKECSGLTIEKYNRDLSAFCIFSGSDEVTKERVIAYKQYLIDKGLAERSINSMIAAINRFFNFAGWYDCRVKALKLAPEIYRAEEKELTEKEYKRLVKTALKLGKYRTAMIIQTICGTGIRISELRFFTVEAVKRGEVTVSSKGKTRKVYIVHALKKMLLEYIRRNHIETGVIFCSKQGKPIDRTLVWKNMKSLCAKANISPSKVYPHNLRHLFAQIFYSQEKDLARLADVLGHSSIKTTRIYVMSSGREHKKLLEKMGLVCSYGDILW